MGHSVTIKLWGKDDQSSMLRLSERQDKPLWRDNSLPVPGFSSAVELWLTTGKQAVGVGVF